MFNFLPDTTICIYFGQAHTRTLVYVLLRLVFNFFLFVYLSFLHKSVHPYIFFVLVPVFCFGNFFSLLVDSCGPSHGGGVMAFRGALPSPLAHAFIWP